MANSNSVDVTESSSYKITTKNEFFVISTINNEKAKDVHSFSKCRDNVNYFSNIQAGVKTDCFDTNKNANCATTINHAASCKQTSNRAMYHVNVLLIVRMKTVLKPWQINRITIMKTPCLMIMASVLMKNCFVKLITTTIYPQSMLKLNLTAKQNFYL